jgi:hypothetical protein
MNYINPKLTENIMDPAERVQRAFDERHIAIADESAANHHAAECHMELADAICEYVGRFPTPGNPVYAYLEGGVIAIVTPNLGGNGCFVETFSATYIPAPLDHKET